MGRYQKTSCCKNHLYFGMETPDNSMFFRSSLLLFCSCMLGLIFISGLGANLIVLLVFYRKPGLRTTANKFVINLMIINIVTCLSLLPINLIDNVALLLDDHLCFAEQFSSVFCSSVIVYAVLLIGIDQYFAVVDPLHYHYIISTWKGYLMIISSWGFSAILALLSAFQPDFRVFHNVIFQQCSTIHVRSSFHSVSEFSFNISEAQKAHDNSYSFYRAVFSITYVTAAFGIPFGFITFIYYRICAAASGNSRRTRTSILASEECTHSLKEKFQTEKSEKNVYPSHKNSGKQNSMTNDSSESHSLLQKVSQDYSNPFLVVTRPSPPKPLVKSEIKGNFKCECAKEDLKKECSESKGSNENQKKPKTEYEVLFLKSTIKSNQSFSKLSSLHIQFSNSIEKFNENSNERRHSNIPMTTLDPEFENLSKTRSSSVQSNFYEIPSRSPSSTRSTATSIYIQSSRSSSLNSTSTRLPPSRASSIRSTSSYLVHNIKHRISNASLFRYREEARAARISIMVIVMALFCWLPFFVIFSLYYGSCFGKYSHLPHYLGAFSIVLLLTSTVVSPFLFAFRNRQIKKEVKKIFRFCPKYLKRDCSRPFYKQNFSLNLKFQTLNLFNEESKKYLRNGNEA